MEHLSAQRGTVDAPEGASVASASSVLPYATGDDYGRGEVEFLDTSTLSRSPVLWTRGSGCHELAELLSPVEPVRVQGDLAESCIRHRARLLVTRRLSNFDLVGLAVPVDFDPGRIGRVVAAVAGGPHSPLAARVARRLGERLGVEAEMVCAYREDPESAVTLIEGLYREVPDLSYRLVRTDNVSQILDSLSPDTLLVLGAPGGTWFQRTLFGPGARLRQRAPAGAVVVRAAPTRVFQVMQDPIFVGPLRQAADILRVHAEELLAVVDRGRLIGVVRREALRRAPPDATVASLMEPPVSVPIDGSLDDAVEVAAALGGAPVPVTDETGVLVGTLLVSD